MTQLSAGFQKRAAKLTARSIFFQDKRDLDTFESGTYEFDAV